MGVVGPEAQLALGAAQPCLDQGRDRSEGFVADRQLDGAVAGVRDELRRSVFDHALFGFFGFPFFGGDFGALLHVFFAFDRAAVFVGFGFFDFFAFRFFGFVFGRGKGSPGEAWNAQRLRRSGAGQQREQQQSQEEGKEPAHRSFIGATGDPL
jgi:hypothetical protein